MSRLLLVLVFASVSAFTAEKKCLYLPDQLSDIATTIKGQGKYVQSVADVKIIAGADDVDEKFLRTYGKNILAGNSNIGEKMTVRQDGCKRLTFHDVKDPKKYELIISDRSSESQLILTLDWAIVIDKFAKEYSETLTTETAKKEYLDSVAETRDQWISSRKDSIIWSVNKAKGKELTHTFTRKFTEDRGTPEIETTIVARWGADVTVAKESAKVLEFRKAVDAAIASPPKKSEEE